MDWHTQLCLKWIASKGSLRSKELCPTLSGSLGGKGAWGSGYTWKGSGPLLST